MGEGHSVYAHLEGESNHHRYEGHHNFQGGHQYSSSTTPIGLRGPNTGSELACNQQNPLTTSPFGNDLLAHAKVSPEVV